MKNHTIILFLFLILACNNPKEKKSLILAKKEDNKIVKKDSVKEINEIVLRESFVDSTTIGIKGKYKIELHSYNNMDSTYVELKLSEKNIQRIILKLFHQIQNELWQNHLEAQ